MAVLLGHVQEAFGIGAEVVPQRRVFGVPEDYDASDLPASPAFFELAVIPLFPDPDPDCLGLLTPAFWQSHLLKRKPSSGISYATEEASVRLVDPDVLREYISIPVS